MLRCLRCRLRIFPVYDVTCHNTAGLRVQSVIPALGWSRTGVPGGKSRVLECQRPQQKSKKGLATFSINERQAKCCTSASSLRVTSCQNPVNRRGNPKPKAPKFKQNTAKRRGNPKPKGPMFEITFQPLDFADSSNAHPLATNGVTVHLCCVWLACWLVRLQLHHWEFESCVGLSGWSHLVHDGRVLERRAHEF